MLFFFVLMLHNPHPSNFLRRCMSSLKFTTFLHVWIKEMIWLTNAAPARADIQQPKQIFVSFNKNVIYVVV